MDASYKPLYAEVRSANDRISYAQGKEDQTMMIVTKTSIQLLPLYTPVVEEAVRSSQPAAQGGSVPNEAVAGLRRAFLRRAHQTANFRDKQFRELETASDDEVE